MLSKSSLSVYFSAQANLASSSHLKEQRTLSLDKLYQQQGHCTLVQPQMVP
uniref:DNA binding / catalytic/ nuclease n=1 Tax=Arundo donax TaxID=35708 RepID=A0A0A9DC71_ARUDO